MSHHRSKSVLQFSKRLSRLDEKQIARLAEIAGNYFPDPGLMRETVQNHLALADTVRLACDHDRIVGFSIASKFRMHTPFHSGKTNVMYQRMLFLEPGALYRGLGLRLLALTLKDLFGWWWPFRRFVAICRTQNPVVARIMDMYNVAYPQNGQPLPSNIQAFEKQLLPVLAAKDVDDRGRLLGSMPSLTGIDYTDIWNRYLHHRKNKYEKLMLGTAFHQENGRIINSGALLLMVGYARPFHFIRYLYY